LNVTSGTGQDKWGQPRTEPKSGGLAKYEAQEQFYESYIYDLRPDSPWRIEHYCPPHELFQLIISKVPKAKDGMQSIHLSATVQAWTAFEVLKTDLWITAVNLLPELAVRFGNSGQKQDKNFTLASLSKYGKHDFNLSGMMGTILYEESRADFTSLKSSRFAYDKAFGAAPALFDVQHLQLLELVRNLILHNAQNVDQKFIDEINEKGLAAMPECANLTPKEPFPLSGETASKFLETAGDCGNALLEFVDSKLK
jgi:hypothetical protein